MKTRFILSLSLFYFTNFSIDETDPALNNAEIEKVLIENNREAVIKTEQVR